MTEAASRLDEVDLLAWELMAMAGASHRLRTDEGLRDDSLARSAFMDSFLVHVRILTEYFMGRLGQHGVRTWKPKTDLVPHDLVPAWMPPELGQQLDLALPKIDAFLSHLSRRRLDPTEAWGFVGLADTVMAVAAIFEAARREVDDELGSAFHQRLFLANRVLARGPIPDAR